MNKQSTSYMVTGGAGFIGSNLVARLLGKGASVLAYDNFSREGSKQNVSWLRKRSHGNLKVVNGDIRDSEKLQSCVKGQQVVVHLAGQVAATDSVTDPFEDFTSNVVGTVNVLEAVRKVDEHPIIIFSSSNKVYGDLSYVPTKSTKTRYSFENEMLKDGIPEMFPLLVANPYGCSKAAADLYVTLYHSCYGIRTVVFRQSCIYGPRQYGTEDQGWLFHIAKTICDGGTLTAYGDGKQVRDLLYIDDLIDAFEEAVSNISKAAGKTYNIGGGVKNSVSFLEAIRVLEEIYQTKANLSFDEWRTGDQKIFCSNNTLVTNDLGWQPRTSVATGMQKLRDWIEELATS